MARIRTIKPEFPQSESMGRISRDARLLFILLWTFVDDSGRARASSRMLASLLFPYDDDAPTHIGRWLDELEAEGCIQRYIVDNTTYLEIVKWLNHQKIDRPSPSKIPGPREPLASPREDSMLDLGPRTKDLGEGKNAIPATKLNSEKSNAIALAPARMPACAPMRVNGSHHSGLKKIISNGSGISVAGVYSDQQARDEYAVGAIVPHLPGRDDGERWAIAMAAEDPSDPGHQSAVLTMLKVAKAAGVGWISPERRGKKLA